MLIAGDRRKTMHGGELETTNNRMELTAAIEALNALRKPARVTLHTDSKYVMDGIKEWLPNWKKRGWRTASKKPVKNQDLWQALDAATERRVAQGLAARLALNEEMPREVWEGIVNHAVARAIEAHQKAPTL